MLSKILKFVKEYQDDLILFFGVIFLCFFSFALGYIIAKNEEKPSLEFQEPIYETRTYRNYN